MSVSIKCNLNGEVRRFTLKESRYEVLKEMVQNIFRLPADSFVLKYKDDEGELVSLGSDAELEEAIALHSGKKLLYLNVVPVSAAPETVQVQPQSQPEFCETRDAAPVTRPVQDAQPESKVGDNAPEAPEIPEIPDEDKESDADVRHDNVACDGCGMTPIIGVRYKCSVCPTSTCARLARVKALTPRSTPCSNSVVPLIPSPTCAMLGKP
eukprot:TRINITY_DN307_c0_g1_i2.p1 TRINITY_DN307_c0_g1~~TRINITY_DN307_c0_g1_i2.p1  ORF type:complete len:225 (+),score=39.42 TRINITY_DN307_c0_g1_i2:48-677(+)